MLRAPKRLYKLLDEDFKHKMLKKFIDSVEPRVKKAIEEKESKEGDDWRRTKTPEIREIAHESLRGYHPDGNDKVNDADKLAVLIDLGLLIADADDAYWSILTYAWNEVRDADLELKEGELYLKDFEEGSQLQREVKKKRLNIEPDFEEVKLGMTEYDYPEEDLKDSYD